MSPLSPKQKRKEEERLKDYRSLQRPLQASRSRVLVVRWQVFAEKALYATKWELTSSLHCPGLLC